ncbi:HAD-IA family hydrolase [Sinomonas humi]|uniref:Beta-phosphoglucomutase n=1 Tax=Sinomonas humi TaxID=1338436 RepID=A0A0B2ALI8_9MICC|nr:HAD-IA family hydrolase [Sinomonas humi]KHL04206.1 beta-phosphoglucomutase [Sinomonas humi]
MTRSPTWDAARPPFDAVVFDLDGVVTDTAVVHEAAWRELFDSVLNDPRAADGDGAQSFSRGDYLRFVDGRPREEGVLAFLGSRGISIARGSADDAPGSWSAFGLGALKDQLFKKRLEAGGVEVFEGTAQLLSRLHAGHVPVALATASRNAEAVLKAAHLQGAFDVVIDGVEAARLRLPGKPRPDTFLEAARRLGLESGRAVVIEDSAAGVEAAHRGGFGLVVGIDRGGRRTELEKAGADVVLDDVGELDLGLVIADPWLLVYEGTDPGHEGHREALTTLSNGYVGVRGAAAESGRGGIGYPGTYLSGVYNRVVNLVEGHETEDEHMVNGPNWIHLDLSIRGGNWWSQGGLTLISERRVLDLRRALLTREAVLTDDDGHRLRVLQRRFVSMADPHLMALETTVTAEGWSGKATVRSGLDLDVSNENVFEDSLLARRHLVDVTALDEGESAHANVLTAEAETIQSKVRIATAMRTVLEGAGGHPGATGRIGGLHFHEFTLELLEGRPARIAKTVAFATSRDRAISSPKTAALAALERSERAFGELLTEHSAVWKRLLPLFTVRVDAATHVQLVVNLHVFHVLQVLAPCVADLDVGVPARGLHGEGYRGHVFWDELFVLPLITSRIPAVARSLIAYRWRRLPAARAAAAAQGLKGALFPWQSGSDGREETPQWIFNPRSGHWLPDRSRLQRHVGLGIAFNAWQYFEATRDRYWLLQQGAELVIEVARLFVALAEYDVEEDRFHLRGLMGPDEYHTGYPDRQAEGIDDNAYTNAMSAWVCHTACRIPELVQGHDRESLIERLRIRPEEQGQWEHLSRRMAIPFHDEGIISQFAGYGDLEELDWDAYRDKYHNIERLDLILEAEGDSTNRYKLSKQADALMLLYLFGRDELITLLDRLGYSATPEQLARSVDYYLSRTAHGSTLSRVAHASVLASMDPERAWETFREALDADLDDTQGGTTRAGVHLGAMAGTIDVVQRSFAGLRLTADALVFAPQLPRELRSVAFRVRYRDQLLDIRLEHGRLSLVSAPGDASPIRLRVGNEEALLAAGGSHHFRLSKA